MSIADTIMHFHKCKSLPDLAAGIPGRRALGAGRHRAGRMTGATRPARERPCGAHYRSYHASSTARAGCTAIVGPKLVMYCSVWLWWAVICSALSFSLSSVECPSDTSTTW
jgi:hypothetical protein